LIIQDYDGLDVIGMERFGPSNACLRAVAYNINQETHRGSQGAKKRKHEKPSMSDAAVALAHYQQGHRWKSIFHNFLAMRKIKLVCPAIALM
jgi:hypothetical protein